ncbi:hypothetical protein L5515_015892 [Caenorhabditis briggsae]|uniref:Uncharacterized protein n=1 Tax=Caenorhabditis briggsae TaxID=6238 RepID=A0AAE9EGC1_CAEBR|nr:hypothetical protein L5515_015892 [Caenorhabditis briggsae]
MTEVSIKNEFVTKSINGVATLESTKKNTSTTEDAEPEHQPHQSSPKPIALSPSFTRPQLSTEMSPTSSLKLVAFTCFLAMASGAYHHHEKTGTSTDVKKLDFAIANRRECKVQLALFAISLCGDVCDSESAADLVHQCCTTKCTAEQVTATCCPIYKEHQ